MKKAGRLLHTLMSSWIVAFLMAFWLWSVATSDFGARTHGNYRPVVSPMVIDRMEPATYDFMPATRIAGSATKLRRCSPTDMQWYLRENGIEVTVPSVFRDAPQVRDLGEQKWSALLVGVPPSMIPKLRAEVTHLCGALPVISTFYVGEEAPNE